MRKWNEIKNQPITWGGYAKMCGISMAISYGITAAYWAYLYKDEIGEKIKNKLHK